MGRVTTEATILNLNDVLEAAQGKLADDQVRKVVVPNALVDTGAWSLSLPTFLIRQLGLIKLATKQVMTSKGSLRLGVMLSWHGEEGHHAKAPSSQRKDRDSAVPTVLVGPPDFRKKSKKCPPLLTATRVQLYHDVIRGGAAREATEGVIFDNRVVRKKECR